MTQPEGGQPLRTCDNSRKANQVLALTAKVKTLEEQIDTLKTKIKQPKMTDFVIRKLDTAAEQALEVAREAIAQAHHEQVAEAGR